MKEKVDKWLEEKEATPGKEMELQESFLLYLPSRLLHATITKFLL
jgi:hypothetical protein